MEGEDWPHHLWALQVWANWPHLAELELQPSDLLPPVQRALELPSPRSCPLGWLALRLFALCSLGEADRAQALAGEGLAALTSLLGQFLLVCSLREILASGWPIFSLLSLLRLGTGFSHAISLGEERLGLHAAGRQHWGWETLAELRPPSHSGRRQDNVGWRCSRRAARPFLRAASKQRLLMAGASALAVLKGDWRVAERQLSNHWLLHRERALEQLFASPAPLLESLRLLELPPFSAGAVGLSSGQASSLSLLQAARSYFLQRPPMALGSIASIEGSILPSEAFFLHSLAELVGATVLVESGIHQGGSTRAACAWAREQPGLRRVVSLERAHLDASVLQELEQACCCGARWEWYNGDAFTLLEGLLSSITNQEPFLRLALFVDGPKGRVAVRLLETVLQRFPQVMVAAAHDVPRLDPRYRDSRGRHLTRLAMEQSRYASIFSDDHWFTSHFSNLDAGMADKQNQSHSTGSYGHTLGAFVRRW